LEGDQKEIRHTAPESCNVLASKGPRPAKDIFILLQVAPLILNIEFRSLLKGVFCNTTPTSLILTRTFNTPTAIYAKDVSI
jgi:hypothetical protein